MDDAQWESTRRANLDSVIYVCRAAIPVMGDGSRIVLIASTAGQRGEAFHVDYAATKGAIISMSLSRCWAATFFVSEKSAPRS